MRKILDFDDASSGGVFRGINGIAQISIFFRIDPVVEIVLQVAPPGSGPALNPVINDEESADYSELQRANRLWVDTDVVLKDSCIQTFYMNGDSIYRLKNKTLFTITNAVAYFTSLGI